MTSFFNAGQYRFPDNCASTAKYIKYKFNFLVAHIAFFNEQKEDRYIRQVRKRKQRNPIKLKIESQRNHQITKNEIKGKLDGNKLHKHIYMYIQENIYATKNNSNKYGFQQNLIEIEIKIQMNTN